MGRKNLLLDLVEDNQSDPPGPESVVATTRERTPTPTLGSRGAVGAMSRSLEQLSAEREAAKALSERFASGELVLEIDPDLIDDSMVPDRMKGSNVGFAEFTESIRTRGQLVPVLMRPNPANPSRYQLAYGHRRVRSAREIGRPVRALVRNLSDDELVIAQGKENSEREDLSFIERARYATLLEDRSFGRDTIMAALSVDKTELSRLISVYRAIPAELTEAIGPAPKVGRRRWMDLVDRLREGKPSKPLEGLLVTQRFIAAASDDRFAMILSALTVRRSKTPIIWTGSDGKKVAKIDKNADRFVLALDERVAPSFGEFLLDKLPELYDAFRHSREGT
jgi:ParB family transcriptional regulator, chromosome partitioning protein